MALLGIRFIEPFAHGILCLAWPHFTQLNTQVSVPHYFFYLKKDPNILLIWDFKSYNIRIR